MIDIKQDGDIIEHIWIKYPSYTIKELIIFSLIMEVSIISISFIVLFNFSNNDLKWIIYITSFFISFIINFYGGSLLTYIKHQLSTQKKLIEIDEYKLNNIFFYCLNDKNDIENNFSDIKKYIYKNNIFGHKNIFYEKYIADKNLYEIIEYEVKIYDNTILINKVKNKIYELSKKEDVIKWFDWHFENNMDFKINNQFELNTPLTILRKTSNNLMNQTILSTLIKEINNYVQEYQLYLNKKLY